MKAPHPSRNGHGGSPPAARFGLIATAIAVLTVGFLTVPASAANTFSANVRVFDTTSTNPQTGAEPSLELDSNNNVFVVETPGARLWRSTNAGANWKYLGQVDSDLGVPAGNDTDVEFDGLNRLYAADLAIGLGLSTTISRYTSPTTITSVTQRDFRTIGPPGEDRQWLATFGNQTVYLTYHDAAAEDVFVASSFDGGQTFLPPVSAITDPVLLADTTPNTNMGRIVTDQRTGAVYVGFAASLPQDNAGNPPFGPHRRAVIARSFDNGLTWEDFIAFEGPPGTGIGNLWPSLSIDRSGNLYFAFAANLDANLNVTTDGNRSIFYIRSTNQGATWSRPVKVNQDAGSKVMPWVVAGCAGKVDIVWYGTDRSGDPNTFPNSGTDAPDWNVYFAQTLNGLNATPTFTQTKVSDHVTHRGQISTGGLTGNADRRLADFFEVDNDSAGMAHTVWADTGTSSTATAQVYYSHQTAGTGILGCSAPVAAADVSGGGYIVVGGNQNSFGFNVRTVNPSTFPGHLTYIDHSAAGFTFKSTKITSAAKNGNQVNFSGQGLINNTLSTTFTVTVVDKGEPGRADTFEITLGTGYHASGTLGGGNIQIHK
jgi:hypothetical protein